MEDNTPSETSDIDAAEKKSNGNEEEGKRTESEESKVKTTSIPPKLQKNDLIAR